MITVNEADKETAFIWGMQPAENCKYRLFSYVLKEGARLLNTVSGKVVELNQGELVQLKNSPETMTTLINDWFLVPAEHEDRKSVDMLRKNITAFHSTAGIVSYTILPTTFCNASCFYCYEYGITAKTMSPDTADNVAKFIIEHSKSSKIQLRWFGGEPLLGKSIISRICSVLNEHGMNYESVMITNGLLFDNETVNEAVYKWKLNHVQITIDGTKETYNRVKSYKITEADPFETVIENIKNLLNKGIFVSVRMNMDMYNIDDLDKLIHYLADEFKERRNLSADIRCLYENEGRDPVSHCQSERDFLEHSAERLREQLRQFHIRCYNNADDLPKLKTSLCMADNDGAVLINPDGNIGKCEHCIFDHLYTSECDNDARGYWKERSEYDMCSSCVFYPSCIRLMHCANLKPCNENILDKKINHLRQTVSLL